MQPSIAVLDSTGELTLTLARKLPPKARINRLCCANAVLAAVADDVRWDALVCELGVGNLEVMALFHALEVEAPDLAERVIFLVGEVASIEGLQFLEEVPNYRLEYPCDGGLLWTLVRRQMVTAARPPAKVIKMAG